MILNALRVALRIFRGKIIFISRLSHSAECDKRHFHERGCNRYRPVCIASAVDRYAPSCEKSISAKPAGLAEMQIKIIIPLSMRRANAERIFNR